MALIGTLIAQLSRVSNLQSGGKSPTKLKINSNLSYGGAMRSKLLLTLVAALVVFAFTIPASAQISQRTGTIIGKVADDKGGPLPGVSVSAESDSTAPQTATTGPTGSFRFANLPPGTYSVTFSIEGFTEVRQEDVRVNVGGTVQLDITLRPTLAEEFVVVADTPVVDTNKTGNDTNFDREYLDKVPSGRDPWVIIEQTPGIDNDRINIAGSESGQQTGFFARGASDADNAWNYDGVNATDPLAIGASPTYYDFDAFEEITIQSGGADASIGAKGVVVNLVTKRAGNKWEANASYYFTNEDLQSDNTPDELIELGVFRSNRIDQVYEYGFDIGGPIVKDKLFAWGAYRRNQIDLFTRVTNPFTGVSLSDKTKLSDINLKVNFNANAANESQFGYFDGAKEKSGRGFNPPIQAEETLWEQGSPGTILEGIWTGQHTFIPNDHTILNARYGYIGLSFELRPAGGNCPVGGPCELPMIFLAAIPRFEDTGFNVSPIDRPAHDFNVDLNWFKEAWAGGDHEFKFGFEYKSAKGHTFSSYGNGALIVDYYQTVPNGPLTAGYSYLQHFIDGDVEYNTASFYATDTLRMDRLTLNLGFRVDSASGQNPAGSIPGVPGFENIVGPVDFAGNDRTKRFTYISPRLGATYDITGDGKTIVRGNYARYYDGYTPFYDQYSNPTFVYNGAIVFWNNLNGDRIITQDELVGDPLYYGGLNGPIFDIDAFIAKKIIDDLDNSPTDEFVIGFEREVVKDFAVFGSYTYRNYSKIVADVPFGVTAADYVPVGVVHFSHPDYGTFDVPYSDISFQHDGTHILKNIEDYSQTYSGFDIGLRKRMSNNFMLNGFVTIQQQKAHYDGGDSFLFTQGDGISLRTVYADPAIVPLYDDEAYAFVSGGSGKTGVFPFAEWTFRMSGVYQMPWDMSLGAFVRYQQGYPQPLFAQVTNGLNLGAFYAQGRLIPLNPIGELRYENIFTLDFNVQKVFEFSNYGRLTVAVDLFNVTNTNVVIQRERRTTTASFNALQENISPRAVRFGFKYGF